VSLKDKYNRPKPDQIPPKKKGNSEVISKIVGNEIAPTDRKVKKATFELEADLHKRLRTFAVLNDTTMLNVVEKAINEYLERMDS
jgi:hypothetical protein